MQRSYSAMISLEDTEALASDSMLWDVWHVVAAGVSSHWSSAPQSRRDPLTGQC